MSISANYFFVDGSALTAQIRQLWRSDPVLRRKKLCPRAFIRHFGESLRDLHDGSYKRATFYFPDGDQTATREFLRMPDMQRPGEVRDLHFKFCGHKLKKSAEFDAFVEQTVPDKFKGRFSKSEKGIDIEICCDALRLASTARLERLFLLTNDSDFIPLFRTLKHFGTNISILHLSDVTPPNTDLLQEADSYDIVAKIALENMFFSDPIEFDAATMLAGRTVEGVEKLDSNAEEPVSEKPDAEPSDLKNVEGPNAIEKDE